jgi:hypothetical protein
MPRYRTALDNKIDRLFHYQAYRFEFLESTIRHGLVRFARASETAIEVNYSAEYPQFSLGDGTDLSPFHSKSADWCYEQEYRLIAQETSEALGSGTLMTRDGFYQLSQGSLLSIIIGSCAPETTSDEIAEIARPAGILLRKATRVPHRYELSIDPRFD